MERLSRLIKKFAIAHREDINRFFKEGEEDWVEIDDTEYQKRKDMEMTANATD